MYQVLQKSHIKKKSNTVNMCKHQLSNRIKNTGGGGIDWKKWQSLLSNFRRFWNTYLYWSQTHAHARTHKRTHTHTITTSMGTWMQWILNFILQMLWPSQICMTYIRTVKLINWTVICSGLHHTHHTHNHTTPTTPTHHTHMQACILSATGQG